MRVSSLARQSGAIVPLMVFAVGTAAIAAVLGMAYFNARRMANDFASDRDRYLESARTAIGTWYERNLSLETSEEWTIGADEIMRLAGVRPQYSVRLVLSPQLSDGPVRYRRVAIVVPGNAHGLASAGGYGTYSSDGTFVASAGFRFVEYVGREAQYRALADTNKSMEKLAAMLERRVLARMEVDASRDSTKNYFRPLVDCEHRKPNEMPCTNGAVQAADYFADGTVLGEGQGIPSMNAWGAALILNSDPEANSVEPPYTMTIQTVTPWNSTLITKAVQPIY